MTDENATGQPLYPLPYDDAPDTAVLDPESDARDRPMSLGDHFEELRWRLMRCAAFFFPPFIAGLALYPWLWELALLPARRAARMLGEPMEKLIVLRPEGPADLVATVARWDAAVVALLLLPVWVYHLWMFLAPGLRAGEKAALKRILGSGSILFLAGAATAYWWGAPLGLAFLLPFNQSLAAVENQWGVDGYLAFLQMVCLGFGLAFETPLAMWALARAGLLTTRALTRYWRHTVLAVVILSAILTPPDPFTQLLMSAVILLLMLAGAWLVRLGERQAAEAAGDSPFGRFGE